MSRAGCWWSVACLAAGNLLGTAALPVQAHDAGVDSRPGVLREVAFDQRMNEPVPLGLVFRDEAGKPVRLGESFASGPVILVPVYYRCPNLCPLVLDGLVRALRGIAFDAGDQFRVVAVSIDPRETPGTAASAKARTLRQYGRPGTADGWHFLTGEEASVQQLTQAIGFRHTFDGATSQFAHATGLVLLTPRGRIFRYMYGIEFSPRDLRLSLVEASGSRLGTPIDQALLFCFRYDPVAGRYNVIVMSVLRLVGLATVGGLGTFIAVMWRRDRRQAVAARRGA